MGNCASQQVPQNLELSESRYSGLNRLSETDDSHSISKSYLEDVDLKDTAPAPLTKSPHALPRTVEDQQRIEVAPAELQKFRNGVSKVLFSRRVWSQLASELESAEEIDLLLKAEFKREMESGLGSDHVLLDDEPATLRDSLSRTSNNQDTSRTSGNSSQSNATPSANSNQRQKAINSPKMTTREKLAKRKAYLRKAAEFQIEERDIYSGSYKTAGDDYLWGLTYSQHRARQQIGNQPIGKNAHTGKDGRMFEIAQLPRLDDDTPLTEQWILKMIDEFRQERVLSYNDAFQIIRRAVETLIPEENVVSLKIPKTSQCAVVGDIHGQLDDLLMIFREYGYPSSTSRILFNGDFVDRGSFSSEVVLTLMAFRALYPTSVYLNRGNHECADMNSVDGFQKEVELKYTTELYHYFNFAFAALPIAHLITVGHQRVFVVHAGLSYEDVTIPEINAEDRFKTMFPMNSILQDLIWSDPYDGAGRQVSRRGAGCLFGADVVTRFLIKNSVHLILRSHECEDSGFALWFDNRLYTIFSASNYVGDSGNYGAFCILSHAPAPQIRVYMAKQQVLSYTQRQLHVRQTLLSKLLYRISSKIYEIESELQRLSIARGTPGYVPPYVWSYVLHTVLKVDIAFIHLARQIGVNIGDNGKKLDEEGIRQTLSYNPFALRASANMNDNGDLSPVLSPLPSFPKKGDGIGGGMIDENSTRVTYNNNNDKVRSLLFERDTARETQLSYIQLSQHDSVVDEYGTRTLINIKKWCAKYKPLVSEEEGNNLQSKISALLYDTTSPFRAGLESLFKHFDRNGDGTITSEELAEGLEKVLKYLDAVPENGIAREEVEQLIERIDLNKDGEIDYNEFFQAFGYGHIRITHRFDESDAIT